MGRSDIETGGAPRTEPKIGSRRIADEDLGFLADFLGRGLGYPASYFRTILNRLKEHPTPAGRPKYGYVLTDEDAIVGASIQIYSYVPGPNGPTVRCHMASWCVEEKYRPFAALFFRRALRATDVTYINTSARPLAVPIIRAQGFSEYSNGQFLSLPLLTPSPNDEFDSVRVVSGSIIPNVPYDEADRQLLSDHHKYGCIALWCITSERAFPILLQKRLFRGVVPGVQLIYCHHTDDFVRFSRAIGRYLATKGIFFARLDANGPMPGLFGWYFNRMEPRYCKGEPPRLGDLAYTQAVLTKFRRRPTFTGRAFSMD